MTVDRRVALAALAAAPQALRAQAPREVHGAHDAWAEPGLALAWGVLRGRDEADTRVWIRIEADPQRHARISAQGRDPFGGGTADLLPPTPNTGVLTIRVPRSHFADHPRTELRFAPPAAGAAPLLVYYLGVPDTTPESTTEAQLLDSLRARLTRARAALR